MTASVWAPGTAINANDSVRQQSFVATPGQTVFTLTAFNYAVGTNSLAIFIDGLKQRITLDFQENDIDEFKLLTACAGGEIVYAEGLVKVTGTSVTDPNAARKGVNSDITELRGLTTPLSLGQGGTGGSYANAAALLAGIGAAPAGGTASSGPVTASGLTMATNRILGRTTASTGAVEELSVVGAALSSGSLTTNVIQVVEGTPFTLWASDINLIPNDDTIPQQGGTEGTEYVSVTITPTSATSRLRIEAEASALSADAARTLTGALFQDSTASAIAASQVTPGAVNFMTPLRVVHEMAAGTTSATTFKFRLGAAAGTMYVNGPSTGRSLGGINAIRIRVTEIRG